MCQYCWDQDDYDARHGHKCDDDCADFCPECGVEFCVLEFDGCPEGCLQEYDDEDLD